MFVRGQFLISQELFMYIIVINSDKGTRGQNWPQHTGEDDRCRHF